MELNLFPFAPELAMSQDNQKSISQSIADTAAAPFHALGNLYDKSSAKAAELGHAGQERAGQAYDAVTGKTSDLAHAGIEGASDTKENIAAKVHDLSQASQDKAACAYNAVAGKSQDARDCAGQKAHEIGDQTKQNFGHAANKAGEMKDGAENELSQGLHTATSQSSVAFPSPPSTPKAFPQAP